MFEDLSIIVLFGSQEELQEWMSRYPNITDTIKKSAAKSDGFSCYIEEPGNVFYHFIWTSGGRSLADEIGTLAHEASHYVDKINDGFVKPEEIFPTELKARLFQTVIRAGVEMILESHDEYSDKQKNPVC